MIIEVRQVRANGAGVFEIYIDGSLQFVADTAFMKIEQPLNVGVLGKLTFQDLQGSIIYHAKCSTIDNLKEALIPMKNILLGRQKVCQYEIIDRGGNSCGCFYGLSNGLMDNKTVVELGDRIFKGYDVTQGTIRTVSFYDNESQFAQLTKPLVTLDNLDTYFIYLKNEYSALAPIMAFFAVYYDYIHYAHRGEYVKNSASIQVKYTYNKANSYYNKTWVRDNFGADAEQLYLSHIQRATAEAKARAKKILKIIGIVWAICIIFVLILLFIILC